MSSKETNPRADLEREVEMYIQKNYPYSPHNVNDLVLEMKKSRNPRLSAKGWIQSAKMRAYDGEMLYDPIIFQKSVVNILVAVKELEKDSQPEDKTPISEFVKILAIGELAVVKKGLFQIEDLEGIRIKGLEFSDRAQRGLTLLSYYYKLIEEENS